ncbi:hypothetical protein Sru01_19880 [Sphaerisporangium rufum]|uniref:GH16 domain-containing protein n=1 Tax=Sphaerisporangium rufum TaxID=1381558 RepID=A0A919UXH1_9ACTN|nr:glycoside hydrolase family 16 protein [Sphaerisporangium rufum]GII77006.1 hypothetical protein Sru01_19880 [Sphaerisporangium rufum]
MPIREAYLIAVAAVLGLCPGPGDRGGPPPSGAARPPAAAFAAGPDEPPPPPGHRTPSPGPRGRPDAPPPPPAAAPRVRDGSGAPGGPGGAVAPGGPAAVSPPRHAWPEMPPPPPGAGPPAARSGPPRPPGGRLRPASPAPASPGPAAGIRAPADPRWGAPVLTETFDRLDPRRWEVYHSPQARVNPRTAAATSVRGGALRMTGGIYGGKDLSGGVASTLSQTYGRWEVRFRGEPGRGYSLVALLWSSDDREYAEVDFAEVIDPSRRAAGIYVHRDDAPQAQSQVATDFTRWHTAAVDWLPGRLTFWLDGRRTWEYTGPNVPRGPMHLTLQNDVVCDRWAPCRDATTPPTVSMYVDEVRIYRAP